MSKIAHSPSSHELDTALIVSLTSYKARFNTLYYTLRCILRQNVKPDMVILWLNHGEKADLPVRILALENDAFQISETENLGAYTKLIPALRQYPAAHIITMDDDVFYPANTIEKLLKAQYENPNSIICRSSLDILLNADNTPHSYNFWPHSRMNHTTPILPLGVSSICYPPGCFKTPDIFDSEKFKSLCPTNDDLWFFTMAKLAATQHYTLAVKPYPIPWPGSQTTSLAAENTGRDTGISLTDIQLQNLINKYGIFK
ncbi:MAG: glycosyltransferase [Micavibrio sp.]|nr:glycosyltransferase [Micavibrio sp.]